MRFILTSISHKICYTRKKQQFDVLKQDTTKLSNILL